MAKWKAFAYSLWQFVLCLPLNHNKKVGNNVLACTFDHLRKNTRVKYLSHLSTPSRQSQKWQPRKNIQLKAKRTLVFTGLSFDTHPNNCGSGHGRIDIARAFAQVGCLLVMTCELVANQRRHRFANSLLDDPICLYSRGKELDALVFVRIVALEEALETSLER
jgi:hypothetical protein